MGGNEMKERDRIGERMSAYGTSRREFMQRTSAMGLAATLPAAMIPGAARAATPKSGGHVRVGYHGGSTTDSLDPIQLTSEFTALVFFTVGSQLTEVMPNGQLGPELAESYEPNADATEWTFDLRKDVEFHNGKTLDADDVILSIDRHRGVQTGTPAPPP